MVFVRDCQDKKAIPEETQKSDTPQPPQPTENVENKEEIPTPESESAPTDELDADRGTKTTQASKDLPLPTSEATKAPETCTTQLTIPNRSTNKIRLSAFRIDDQLYELYAPTDRIDELQIALDDIKTARQSEEQARISLEDNLLTITVDRYAPHRNLAQGSDEGGESQEFYFVSDCNHVEETKGVTEKQNDQKEDNQYAALTREEKQNCSTEVDQLCIETCTDDTATCEQRCTICVLGEHVVRDELDGKEVAILENVLQPVLSDEGEQIGMQVTDTLTFVDSDEPNRQLIIAPDTTITHEE